MDLREYLPIDDAQLRRFDDLYARYRLLYEAPDACHPMIIIHAPSDTPAAPTTWEQRLADPLVMLRAHLDGLRSHLEIGDDRVPAVAVDYGTAQIAAAFGCEFFFPENNSPAAGTHVMKRAEDVYDMQKPAIDAGWYKTLYEWIAIFKQNLPPGIQIAHSDIQSTFNSSHLIRGNDILTDFYDQPEAVDALLDLVTDYMIDVTRHMKSLISNDPNWFFDWGAMWKGAVRISNCSMHMISPEFYRDHVLARDRRFFEAVGGGRMHYCGTAPSVIDDFFTVEALNGLDVEFWRHDFYDLVKKMPKRITLIPTGTVWRASEMMKRLLDGDWPEKRNIIIQASAASVDEGKRLLDRLRTAAPWK